MLNWIRPKWADGTMTKEEGRRQLQAKLKSWGIMKLRPQPSVTKVNGRWIIIKDGAKSGVPATQ